MERKIRKPRREKVPCLSEGMTANANMEILNMSIFEVGLSHRTANALAGAGIKYIRDIVDQTEAQLLCVPKFGIACLEEVRRYIEGNGLVIGGEYE